MRWLGIIYILLVHTSLKAQDTTVFYEGKTYTLPEVMVGDKNQYLQFLSRIKNDTTFYKAFRNLRILNFSSSNDILIYNKKGNVRASLHSVTTQNHANGCRTTVINEEHTTGDFYDKRGNYNYTTAAMYASLFFTKGKVCGETNIVKGSSFSVSNKSGMEKHKEQLKQLFFNPGTKIPG